MHKDRKVPHCPRGQKDEGKRFTKFYTLPDRNYTTHTGLEGGFVAGITGYARTKGGTVVGRGFEVSQP